MFIFTENYLNFEKIVIEDKCMGLMDVKSALVWIVAWYGMGNMILSKPMMTQFGTAYLHV